MTVTLFTGPSQVKNIAEKCREVGFRVDVEGIQHVYLDVKIEEVRMDLTPRAWVIYKLIQKFGTSFNLK